MDGEGGRGDEHGGKYEVKNWKTLAPDVLKKMAPQQRSRYFAYEKPSKSVAEAQEKVKRRLLDAHKQLKLHSSGPTADERREAQQHEKLIGQLKAAEARNRIRIMRLRYHTNRAQEIGHLVACQPTALTAVRLQALLPAKPESDVLSDSLDKFYRERVEKLLEDGGGLLTQRVH